MKALTSREREVLSSYAKLGTLKLVCDELELSLSTVKNHLHTSYRKLGTTNAIGAFKAVGWLDPLPAARPAMKPRTKAGKRTLLRYAWEDEQDDMLADILAIEDEATDSAVSKAALEAIALHRAKRAEAEYLCPNCVTPWKCNGPHIPEGAAPHICGVTLSDGTMVQLEDAAALIEGAAPRAEGLDTVTFCCAEDGCIHAPRAEGLPSVEALGRAFHDVAAHGGPLTPCGYVAHPSGEYIKVGYNENGAEDEYACLCQSIATAILQSLSRPSDERCILVGCPMTGPHDHGSGQGMEVPRPPEAEGLPTDEQAEAWLKANDLIAVTHIHESVDCGECGIVAEDR